MNTNCLLCASLKKRFSWRQGGNIRPAARHLDVWRKTVKATAWRNLVDVRQSYPDTDAVKVRSGRTVLVFNIRRNDYRLIAAAHFNRQIVYIIALYDARRIQQRPLERANDYGKRHSNRENRNLNRATCPKTTPACAGCSRRARSTTRWSLKTSRKSPMQWPGTS